MRGLIYVTLFIATIFSGCTKKDGVGTVGITVTNEKGVPIQNCNIKLTVPASVSPGVDWGVDYFYGRTDENGYIEFSKPNNSYFDVYVWKGLWEGCGFVEFIPNETGYKSIIIYPPGSAFNGCI